jgi:hypothetical protein
VTTFFLLGLMSKPMIVTLPLVFLLLDYWPLRRMAGVLPDRSERNHKRCAVFFRDFQGRLITTESV